MNERRPQEAVGRIQKQCRPRLLAGFEHDVFFAWNYWRGGGLAEVRRNGIAKDQATLADSMTTIFPVTGAIMICATLG